MMYRKGDIPDRRAGLNYLREAIGEDREELRARSPVHNASQIRAAVMLVHGALDQRVPVAHATSLRRALMSAGNPVEAWLVERKEGHGFGNPDNRRETYDRMLAFFDQHIGRGADMTANAGDQRNRRRTPFSHRQGGGLPPRPSGRSGIRRRGADDSDAACPRCKADSHRQPVPGRSSPQSVALP